MLSIAWRGSLPGAGLGSRQIRLECLTFCGHDHWRLVPAECCLRLAKRAHSWRWSLIYMGMIFVWTFSLLEVLLLVMYWSTLRLDGWIAWLYVFALAVGSIVAILGVLDWIRNRPSTTGDGPQVPVWQRVFLFIFIAFALYISVPLLIGTATRGSIWPGELTTLSARGFGAFYFAITFGDLFGIFERRLATFHFCFRLQRLAPYCCWSRLSFI